MLNKIIAGLMIATAIATSAGPIMAAPKREVNPRLLALALGPSQCPESGENNLSFCYKTKALVDIDSGYLRVWSTDEEGNRYIVGKLYKSEIVKIIGASQHKDGWYAYISYPRPGCWNFNCYAFVKMAYLR